MKIYIVDGRKVWLNEVPEGYAEVKPAKTEVKDEPKAETKPKAKKVTQNKARKAGSNK